MGKEVLANTKLQIKIEAIFSKSLDFSPARNYKNFFILICHLAFYILNFAFVEKILKQLQLIYMRRRRTTEVISEIVIRFHPKDARKRILAEYQKRLKRLGINPIVN